jgi:hypothetical protein
MESSAGIFLLLNLGLSFYNVGIIWAHEVDIFRSWRLLDTKHFQKIQNEHWKKLPFWVFIPVGLAFAGSITLIWFHPQGSPAWAIWGNLACQLLSHILTGLFWGQWQAKLSTDKAGAKSMYLEKILRTHWVRTLLINAYAFILLAWIIRILAK